MFKMGRWALNNHSSKQMIASKHKTRKTKQKALKKWYLYKINKVVGGRISSQAKSNIRHTIHTPTTLGWDRALQNKD